MRPRFIRLSYFIWLIVPAAVFAAYMGLGLPHFIWSYRFHDNGSPYDPFLERHYISCTFWGPYGMHTIPAQSGRCGYVAFFKQEAS